MCVFCLYSIGLFAGREIDQNEELTINYVTAEFLSTGLMAASNICLCGSDSCLSSLRLPNSYTPIVGRLEITSSCTDLPPVLDKKKSKNVDELTSVVKESSSSAPSSTPDDIPSYKSKPVTSLLSAGTTQTQTRKDRGALISTSNAAARATHSDIQKSGTGVSDKVVAQSESINNLDENVMSDMIGLGPPLHEDFCYR